VRRVAGAVTIAIVASALLQLVGVGSSEAAVVGGGAGFESCQAPSLSSMGTWLSASPYRMVGVYIGGANRACSDGPLSATWLASVQSGGWLVAPLYVGLQAPCVTQPGLSTIDPATAATQGSQSADDAVARANAFQIPPGSPIYFDLEAYGRSQPACTAAVLAFLDGWTRRLHDWGLVSGVYGSAGSLMTDLVSAWGHSFTEPDAIWNGHWDGRAAVFGDPFIPDNLWASHQRIHQYAGGHDETWGGVTINIDNDFSDGLFAGSDVRRAVAVRADGVSGYVLDGFGPLRAFGAAPAVASPSWPGRDIARGVVLRADGVSGYVLDGWGGLHGFGGAPTVYSSGYWPGWDIARGVVLRADGVSGYVLDGFGGVHSFGGAPRVWASAYWPNWGIARAVALRPDGVSGYVVDAWGGVHQFGGAPSVGVSGYWRGWDIARGIALRADGVSGYVLDGWGALHPLGSAPAVTASSYAPGWDIARGVALVGNRGAVVNAVGTVFNFNSP
jgi:hypothetical protein